MVRASSAPDAPGVLLSSFPSGEVQLAHRDQAGGETTAPPTGKADGPRELHLRLQRKGGEFIAAYLQGSGVFREFARVRDVLPRQVLVGAVACSHDPSQLVKVGYANLALEKRP